MYINHFLFHIFNVLFNIISHFIKCSESSSIKTSEVYEIFIEIDNNNLESPINKLLKLNQK